MPNFKKRHAKGSNHSADKRARREAAEEWKKGGNPGGRNGDAAADSASGSLPSGGAYELHPNNVENKAFEAFYKCLNNIRHEKEEDSDVKTEFDDFLETLRRPLPSCFRINPGFAFSRTLVEQLVAFKEKIEATEEFRDKGLVQPLEWFPFRGFGYKLTADRRTIRKDPNLTELHEWLKLHTNNGNLTRQEAVSMVPPIALNISPHHRVLDMCAAPGSKTTQLLEIITNGENGSDSATVVGEAEPGFVIANDSSTDRAYLLVHQCRRLCSPHLMVTTHMAQMLPNTVRHTVQPDGTTRTKQVLFDRVLADVPCSGDGTMRKNPGIWNTWNCSGSHSLHPLQLQIAQRGLQLLAPGGMLVYSTCSMSPYEDEATVAELLRTNLYPTSAGPERAGRPVFEIVDGREHLPKFSARAGLTAWHVFDDAKKAPYVPRDRGNKAGKHIAAEAKTGDAPEVAEGKVAEESKEEEALFEHPDPLVQACVRDGGLVHYASYDVVPELARRKLKASAFPPSPEEVAWMGLEKCMRCVPHDEDSGGFFVATLRRIVYPGDVVEASSDDESDEPAAPTVATTPALPETSSSSSSSDAEPPKTVVFKPSSHSNAQSVSYCHYDGANFAKIVDFYGFITPAQHAAAIAAGQDSLEEDGFSTSLAFSRKRLVTDKSLYFREDSNSGRSSGNNPRHANYGKKVADQESDSLKSIYFCPHQLGRVMEIECASSSSAVTDANAVDAVRPGRLKIVTAGIKAFERQKASSLGKLADQGAGECEYRILQEGIGYLAPYMTKRKLNVTAQDLCNMLEGGLVSYHTLSAHAVDALQSKIVPLGAVVCKYTFDPADVVDGSPSDTNLGALSHYIVAWKGKSRTLNVMASKVDMEAIKLQLVNLGVYRPKIGRNDNIAAAASASASADPVQPADTVNPAPESRAVPVTGTEVEASVAVMEE